MDNDGGPVVLKTVRLPLRLAELLAQRAAATGKSENRYICDLLQRVLEQPKWRRSAADSRMDVERAAVNETTGGYVDCPACKGTGLVWR